MLSKTWRWQQWWWWWWGQWHLHSLCCIDPFLAVSQNSQAWVSPLSQSLIWVDAMQCNTMIFHIFENTPDLNLNSLFSLYSWHLAFKNKNTRGFWKGNVTLRNRERISLISFYTAREVETRPSALGMSDPERTILGVVCWLVCLFVCFNSTWYNMV